MVNRAARRDQALDAVRGMAIVAMVIAHTVVYLRPTAPEVVLRADSVLADLASPLFALVIGATVALVAPPRGPDVDRRRRFQRQFAIKGLLLVPIGWLLTLAPSGVDIILDPLGVTMMCAAPLLFLRSRVLVGIIALLCVAGPLLNAGARSLAVTHRALLSNPVTDELLQWFVLGHNYRVTGLLPVLLVGIVIGRYVPRRRGRMALLLGVSLAAFLVAQLARPLGIPQAKVSGTHVDLLRDLGLAGVVYAAVLLVVALAPRLAGPILEPFAVQGRMALSVYVVHVAILIVLHTPPVSGWLDPRVSASALGWGIQLGLVLLCWVGCVWCWRIWGTGPVERGIGLVTGRSRR